MKILKNSNATRRTSNMPNTGTPPDLNPKDPKDPKKDEDKKDG